MKRVRLTSRNYSAAGQEPYPGNVNQPDRKDPAWDGYHTFEQSINHELPDMDHDWQNDTRDDIGYGIPEPWGKSPTVASVTLAANKAVRVAVLLLGEKVDDEVIEAQARDLMAMSQVALDATIQRFADTQDLYESEDEDEDEEVVAKKLDKKDKNAEDEDEDEVVAKKSDKKDKKAEDEDEDEVVAKKLDKKDKKAEDEDEDKKSSKEEEDKKQASMIACIVAQTLKSIGIVAKKVEDDKKAEDEDEVVAKKLDKKDKKAEDEDEDEVVAKKLDKKDKKAEDEDEDEVVAKKLDKKDKKAEAEDEDKKLSKEEEDKKQASMIASVISQTLNSIGIVAKKVEEDKKTEKVEKVKDEDVAKVGANELDIELTGSVDDEVQEDVVADERLASLFSADDEVEDSNRKVEASHKVGIKKLGGQPRVASSGGTGDISDIWKSAPDVSSVFN